MEGSSPRKSGSRERPDSRKSQSAMEYLTTYGWAILMISAASAIIYLFVSTPSTLVPASCRFAFGAYCQDIVVGANLIGSSPASGGVWLFLSNPQQYMVVNPRIQVNVVGANSVVIACAPANVLPGGAILCIVPLTQTVASGSLVNGKLYLSVTPCQSGNVITCASGQSQTYLGSFNAQVAPAVSPTLPTITLSLQNPTQVSNGAADQLTATVTLPPYNTPIAGATVSFSSNVPYVTITPLNTTTDGYGRAQSLISSLTQGTVTVTATFAGASASNTISFVPLGYTTSTSTTVPTTTR